MSRPVRLLLVEDNPGDARLLRETLRDAESLDFELRHLPTLGEALDAFADDPADLVLLDLSLPDARGLETVTRMLAEAPGAAIVVLSGLADERVAMQAVQAGAQDYLVKGTVDGPTLARAIRYAVERRRLLEREREARASAEAAVRARDEVLRIVAHDIGNALSAVKIHATVLDRLLADGEGDALRRRTSAIRHLTEQMDRLRQDLLDVAAIEAGRLSVNPAAVSLDEVVDDVLAALAPAAEEKGLRLEADLPDGLPRVVADRERLAQVLSNLLGNAVKFTLRGVVRVAAVAAGAEVEVTVSDTGPGIPPEHLPFVFDRFWQARSTRRAGAGLGLAIARGIVEAHGGWIEVSSEPVAGTTFRFTLPAHGR